jgi:hypothetical protein
METFHLNACGAQVSLSLDSRLYDPANRAILGPYDYLERGESGGLELELRYGKRRRALVEEDGRRVVHYRGKAGSHIIRQLVFSVASQHNRTFEIVHGTGVLVDSHKNLGVLLVGRQHCGKSTLSRALGEIIMDDDLMLVNRDWMMVAGRMGFVTHRNPVTGRKYLTPLPNGAKQTRLDIVFILDKRERGGTYSEIDNSIPRRYAVLDDLPPILQETYLRMHPIRVNAAIFRLGTRGRLPQTLDTMRRVMDQYI